LTTPQFHQRASRARAPGTSTLNPSPQRGRRGFKVRGLVVTPTCREAARIKWLIDPVAGDPVRSRRCDVVIGTPARLLEQMRSGVLSVEGVEVLVLDDCDRLARAGYLADLRKLARPLPVDCLALLLARHGTACDHERLAALLTGPVVVADEPHPAVREPTWMLVSIADRDPMDVIRTIFRDCDDYRLNCPAPCCP
jgi:hypothetical protein